MHNPSHRIPTCLVLTWACLLGIAMTTGCKPEQLDGGPGTLALTADFTFAGDSVLIGRTAQNALGQNLRLETFSIYLGGIELLNDTGIVRLSDAERWNAGENNVWNYTLQALQEFQLSFAVAVSRFDRLVRPAARRLFTSLL